ncbi:MAG TPA: methyltransferase domain-containing protein [Candidatus Coproplasma excrementipullorum]|mgnify:FL=1|nr:methyltransferase domain-containing protein [Candidatus Coproplasma excrementipullorum]
MNSYSTLGNWFEYLNKDCDYASWSQYLIKRLAKFNAGPSGADIGCGNGYFTRALYKAGYDVRGIDISPQMLNVAKRRAAEEGVPCEFLLGDITKLKLTGKVHFAVAVNDCLNYVPPSKLKSAFAKVYSCLNRGGLFHFDISSEYKIRHILADNMFGEDGDDISYMWFNTPEEDGVTMELTFFVRGSDGRYDRYEETHRQYAHSEEAVISALKEVGFARVFTEGHLGSDDKSQRINFTALKGPMS